MCPADIMLSATAAFIISPSYRETVQHGSPKPECSNAHFDTDATIAALLMRNTQYTVYLFEIIQPLEA